MLFLSTQMLGGHGGGSGTCSQPGSESSARILGRGFLAVGVRQVPELSLPCAGSLSLTHAE